MANKLLIAKNSAALYIRMLLSLLVSLYTSRIVLEALGVEDFGVYNVVGGIIGFMGFLNASLSGATSRFVAFELGNGDLQKLRDTFSSAFIINLLLAIIIVLIGETIGLWFLNHKLSIPNESIHAANWVYQFTIIGMVISVTQIPYTADVIAHEKMAIYAYVELFVVCLRLLMAYTLLIINSNHLIWYSAMVTAINILMAIIYRVYCVRNFKESHIRFIWKSDIIRPILNFSGWDLFGNICLTVRMQGLIFLINMFFGVVINAAYSIANQVSNNVFAFASNVVTAYRPQIVKNYAIRDFKNFTNLIVDGAKFALISMLCMAIPLIIEIDYVLMIWLKNPPVMTNIFCQFALIMSVIASSNYTVNIGIQATGKVKYLGIVSGLLYLLILLGAYIAFKLGGDSEWIYYVSIAIQILLLISSLVVIKTLVSNFDIRSFVSAIIKVTISALITILIGLSVKNIIPESFARLAAVTSVSIISLSCLTYWFLLTKHERERVNNLISKIFHR